MALYVEEALRALFLYGDDEQLQQLVLALLSVFLLFKFVKAHIRRPLNIAAADTTSTLDGGLCLVQFAQIFR